jgi:hypothetical protein
MKGKSGMKTIKITRKWVVRKKWENVKVRREKIHDYMGWRDEVNELDRSEGRLCRKDTIEYLKEN